jgi:hypothetical protein
MAAIRRRAITLLEVVIVVIILSIASGIVAININNALIEQRFRSEVGLIVDEMRLAQDLMLILGTDVHLHFAETKKGDAIEYWLELETRLPQNVEREIKRKRKALKAIKGVFLEDELLSEIQESHLDVKFLSNGAVMSKGVMRLATSSDENVPKGTLESFICLAGHPKPIVSSRTKEEAEEACQKLEDDLDERLAKDTIERLPEKLFKTNSQDKQTTPEKSEPNPKDNKKQKDPESK